MILLFLNISKYHFFARTFSVINTITGLTTVRHTFWPTL